MKSTSVGWGAVALLLALLSGCGGSDGSAGPAGPAGATGATGATGPAGKDATASVAVPSNAVTPTADAAAAWKAMAPQVAISGVTLASPPVVKFTVTDAAGKPVLGLGNKSQSSTTTVAGLTNLGFTLAKLVPGADGAPSKWVSYNVLRPPTVAEKAGSVAATTSCDSATAPTWCGTFPTTDTQGTLVDNGDGSYQYTFYRDPKQVATLAAGLIDTANGLNKKADLGDLSYDASLTHRLGILVYGNAPGTGSNTPTAVTVTTGVPIANPANATFDFRPDGGTISTTRDIVKIDSCSECHAGKPLAHGGSRKDPKLCVTCHTDQVRYSFSKEATMLADGLTFAVQTGSNAVVRPEQAVLDGRAVGNFPNYLHKIHMGERLIRQGYNYNNDGGAMKFNEVTYPQPVTNCVKCHDGSANAVNKTANGDSWKMVPSRLACGACHDGISFATGKGTALGAAGQTVGGHLGGAQASDKLCALCHGAADVPTYHVTVDPTGANGRGGYPLNTATDTPTVGFPAGQGPSIPLASQLGNLPAGVYKIGLEIKQVTVSGAAGAKKATVVYRISKDGQPVTLNATGSLIAGVDGSPNIMVAYGVPQDGITTPVDWNGPANAVFGGTSIKDIRDKVGGNSQTGPDASGYYTATLAAIIPDDAKMVTAAVGVGYDGFVQLNLPAYPKGIRLREPKFPMKVADGYTARRSIVSGDKCNNCHGQLGVEPSFHSGARNNGEGCAMCHTANWATGHTGAVYNFGGGWSVAIKNLVHSIHSSEKRQQPFTYEATAANPNGFQEVTYPGVLKKCEQCHVAGSYDFSNPTNATALPNLLWTTDARSDMSNPTNAASIGQSPWVTILGKGQVDYSSDNLVSSPVASACFGCHDSRTAVAHMQLNGGTLVSPASTVSTGARPTFGNFLTTSPTASGNTLVFTKVETCMICHSSGNVADIRAVHSK